MAPGQAPTPFTADEIREGCPAGRTARFRVEAPGETPFLRVSRFVECDTAGATFERSRQAIDGSPLADPQVDRVTWRDLQAHASFDAAATVVEPERISTAIGELDCLRYTVRHGVTEEVYWFAKALPGMPVQSLTRTGGQVVSTVAIVGNVDPRA
jgi:hypothetical protein